MPTWPRKIGLGLAVFAAAVIALLGCFVAFLHSGPGERWLSGKLEENVAGLELDGYHLNWPFRMRADYLRLMDEHGPWLDVTRPELKWRPLRLVRGVLEIDRLAARRVEVLRLPAGDHSQNADSPAGLPDIALRLHDLSAPIVLAAPVLGEQLELDLGGSFLMQGGGGAVDVHLRAPGGSVVRLAGTAGWDYLDLRWYLRIAELSRWQRLVGIDLAGEVTGSGFLAGRLPNPVMSGSLDAGRGHAGPMRWGNLELSGRLVPEAQRLALSLQLTGQELGLDGRTLPVDVASLTAVGDVAPDEGRIRLGLARLETAGAALHASGVLEQWGRRSSLRLSGGIADPARFGLPVAGRIEATGQVAGDLPAMSMGGRLHLRAPGLAVGAAAVDRVLGPQPKADMLFHADDGGLRILDARVDGAAAHLRVAGSVGDRLDLRASVSMPDLAPVAPGAAGAATAEMHLTGAAADPDVFGAIRLSGVTAGGAPPGDGAVAFHIRNLASAPTGPITATVAVGGIPIEGRARFAAMRLDDLELVSRQSRVTGHLALVDGGVRGHLSGTIPQLSAWEALAGIPLAGQVRAEADIDAAAGQTVRLDLSGQNLVVGGAAVESFATGMRASGLTDEATQVVIEHLRLARPGADVALLSSARLSVTGEQVRLESATLSLGGGRLYLEGRKHGQDVTARLRLEGVPLELAKLALPGLDITGRVDGAADLSGTVADPFLQAELAGRDVGFAAAARAGIGRLAVRVTGQWQGGLLRAEGSADDGGRLRASAEATLPVPGEGAISGRVQVTGDAGRLSEMMPFSGHVLSGGLEAAAEISGTLAAPLVSGRLSLDNGRYENLENGTLVTDLSARAEISGDSVRVEASGKDGGNGSVRVQGQGALSGAYEGEVVLNGFTALRRDDVEAQLDGSVRLAGEGGQGRIAGDLRVPRAEVDIGRLKGGGPVTLDVIEINKPGQGPPPPARQQEAAETPLTIALAVEVAVEHAFVRGRGLDSEWQGGVTVGGTLTQPSLTGQLKVARGDFDFLGKQFALVPDSAVTFQGGDTIDPALDVTAEVAATDITAQVRVTGTAGQPSFAMTSSPTLPQDEILARVLFGRELGKLSTFQQIQLAQMAASGLTGGGGGFDPIGRVRGLLGLDVLGVGAQDEGAGGPTLSAGKYLGPDTFVRVDQGTAGLGKVTVEQGLGGGFSVESSVGAQSGGGVGLNWRKDY